MGGCDEAQAGREKRQADTLRKLGVMWPLKRPKKQIQNKMKKNFLPKGNCHLHKELKSSN